MNSHKTVPGISGNQYVPFEEREGGESEVFFTRDLSEEGLKRIFDRVSTVLNGKVAVKLHTGEAEGPNIIPHSWVKELISSCLPEAEIIETNTYYKGTRHTTEDHRKTLEINGWTFCPVDITDADGTTTLPVAGGKWFKEMHVGKTLPDYDSLLVLTHFKGHTLGGFGGSNKNVGIGCADGRIGKTAIHRYPGGEIWSIREEELMERMTESTKAVLDYFSPKACFINIMRNMSVDCDCLGVRAEPVITPDIGILASLDVLAVDSACVDMIYNLPEGAGKALIERIESRHGLRQLSYMKELGLGCDRYKLIDIDHEDAVIPASSAVKNLKACWIPDRYNTFWGRNKQ